MKNARMDEFEEEIRTPYPGLQITKRESEKGIQNLFYKSIRGYVVHGRGFIQFYQSYTKVRKGEDVRFLTLYILHNGKEHQRRWEAWYGKKTITRLANEFIEEIKGENP